MSAGLYSLSVGGEELEYVLRRSDRRTLGITVFPSGDVVVSAPKEVAQAELEKRIRRRAGWIRRTQREFESYRPRTPARRYISGETHRYLGGQLRLLVRPELRRITKLQGLFLVVGGIDPTDTAAIGRAVRSWYRRRANELLAARLAHCVRHFAPEGITTPALTVRSLARRWGSMSTDASHVVLNTACRGRDRRDRLRDHPRALSRARAASRPRILRSSYGQTAGLGEAEAPAREGARVGACGVPVRPVPLHAASLGPLDAPPPESGHGQGRVGRLIDFIIADSFGRRLETLNSLPPTCRCLFRRGGLLTLSVPMVIIRIIGGI